MPAKVWQSSWFFLIFCFKKILITLQALRFKLDCLSRDLHSHCSEHAQCASWIVRIMMRVRSRAARKSLEALKFTGPCPQGFLWLRPFLRSGVLSAAAASWLAEVLRQYPVSGSGSILRCNLNDNMQTAHRHFLLTNGQSFWLVKASHAPHISESGSTDESDLPALQHYDAVQILNCPAAWASSNRPRAQVDFVLRGGKS